MIQYHGGPLMLGPTNVYYIWYGDWAGNTAKTILTDFISHIGGSSYFAINSSYYDQSGAHVRNAIHFAGSIDVDSSTHGKSLNDGDIKAIVDDAITSKQLPLDADGVYFVLTSADVSEAGFCSFDCGWHYWGTTNGTTIKYSFVGNPDACPVACAAQTVGPNDNAGADAMASSIAHELEESVTDPEGTGWYAPPQQENGDLCAWNFGAEYQAPNGANANVALAGRDFLIQQDWQNLFSGFCTMTCQPSCGGKKCGAPDGCGGSCTCTRCGNTTCRPLQACCNGICKVLQVGDVCE
jgi:hypothetical protein